MKIWRRRAPWIRQGVSGRTPRETGAASWGNALRRAPDQLKENRLLGDRGRDRAEMEFCTIRCR